MQLKHIISLLTLLISFNIFALPIDDIPVDNEFTTFKNIQDNLESEKQQEFFVREIYERLGFDFSMDHSGLTNDGTTHRLIRMLLRNQNSIDYKYWSASAIPNKLKPALDKLLVTLEIRPEVSTQNALTSLAELIISDTKKSHLDPILQQLTDSSVTNEINRQINWAIKSHHKRMLLEVLLMGDESIDYDYWSENFPIKRQLESGLLNQAVEETMERLIQMKAALDPKYQHHMLLLANHIVSKARTIDRKSKLKRFSDGPSSARRALKKKKTKNVISIHKAIQKSKL